MDVGSTWIGIISDTHGLARESALQALQGVSRIVHAGDIGGPDVMAALERIAPVVAVRGNMDGGEWSRRLPATEVVEAGGARMYVLHDLARLDLDPAAAGFAAVVCGHSHRPTVENVGGVLLLNPGSAGPRRGDLPVSLMRVRVSGGRLFPELVDLGNGDGDGR